MWINARAAVVQLDVAIHVGERSMFKSLMPFGTTTAKRTTLTALAFIWALASPALAQDQDKAFPPANTPSVLPRPDFHFPGNVGRTYLDSDPPQFSR
jgi:hypothetical protein